MKRALVFGGTGTIGREVLRAFAQANVPAMFTYRRSAERARVLATEFGAHAVTLDLADASAVRTFVRGLEEPPTIFVHAAATLSSDLRAMLAVNVESAFAAVQELAPRLATGGDVVLIGALDRAQAIPIPAGFAATQGALSALTMALAKELGPKGIRVNMVASGLLNEGLSKQLSPKLIEDYKTFSALRRMGTADEVARVVAWLACENTYISGKVIPVNGGI